MLRENDKAPSFSLPSAQSGREGKTLGPKDFPGSYVVVYFYPRDNTPGCTREAQAFQAGAAALKKAGAVVLGVSRDTIASHCSFGQKYGLAFPLLADSDLTVHKAFGAWGEKTMYGRKVLGTIRSTFVLDPAGKVAKVFPSVKVDGHFEKVLEAIADLRGGGAKATTPKAKAAPAKKSAAKKAPAKKTTAAAKKPAKKRA